MKLVRLKCIFLAVDGKFNGISILVISFDVKRNARSPWKQVRRTTKAQLCTKLVACKICHVFVHLQIPFEFC